VNIANFALGRDGRRAMGVVNIDEAAPLAPGVLEEIRNAKAIQSARIVRV